jgi:hypothetical protein
VLPTKAKYCGFERRKTDGVEHPRKIRPPRPDGLVKYSTRLVAGTASPWRAKPSKVGVRTAGCPSTDKLKGNRLVIAGFLLGKLVNATIMPAANRS